MLGKIKTAINNYIKRVAAEDAATKEKASKKQQRDFGADISSITLNRPNIDELLKMSFQKSAKDFTVNYNGQKQVAMDSAECETATPAVDMNGTSKDIIYTFFSKFGFIGWQQCALLAQHWLISNACSIPAKDAIRNGWINMFADADKETATEDKEKEQKFLNELNEITNTKYKVSEKIIQWITKYNIYGIGIALPQIDGIDYEKPYNPDGIKKGSFKGISIIDPYWLTPQFDQEAMTDPTAPIFYKPTHYLTAGQNGRKIHVSHFIIIRRKEVPDILKPTYYFGGIPLTQEIYERVYAAEKSANEQPLLLLTKRVNGWKVDLNEFFMNPKKYEQRIRNFTDKRDNQGVLLIDHEDDMFQIDTSLSDLDQVVMSQYKLVAAVARIPVDKLFELNPSGTLSNSGDYNVKNYTQDLNTIQNDLAKPFVDRINEIVMRSYYDKKDKIAIIFNPTDNPTAQEQATNVKTEVDTLQALIGNNVITTEEARQKLISDKRNGFSFLDEEAPEQEQDNEEIAQMMKEQQNKQQGKDTAEDTDWITVHPHGKETKGVPVPVEEGQGKGEAIKQHFARLSNPEEFGDIDFDPEELDKENEEAEKKAKNKSLKKEMSQWNKMSEEEKEAEREQFYEAEEQQSKEKNKEKQNHTLVHEKQILEDMGISRIKKPTPEDDIYKEYNDLSPRIKRYFFTDNKNALKWDEAQQILQEHKGNDTENIFEYLRVIDIKTPQSRTNERTRNYLKGQQAEDEIGYDNAIEELEHIEKQMFTEDYNPDQLRDKHGMWTKGVQYYSKLPKEIREQIKNSTKEIREAAAFAMLGKPVKQLTGNEFQKDDVKLTDKVPAYYQEKYGGKVTNKEIGEVMLDLEGVQDDIGHHLSKLKCCAFAAVPEVVMNGKIFDRQKNWKNRGYDSYVIIAPVKIGTQRYIEEVVVKRNSKRQGFYLHEVEIKQRLEEFIQTSVKRLNPPISKLIVAEKIKKVK